MTSKLRFTAVLSIATLMAGSWVALAPASAAKGLAVQAQHDHAGTTPTPKADDTTAAPESRQPSMMRGEMMARMKQDDDRLQALVTAMNQAKGDAKIAAMATLVTALADGRTAMRDSMMQQSEMMAHMMSMQAAMTACPMMPAAQGTH